jgi:O-antigen/teichoic acid export membrane protein
MQEINSLVLSSERYLSMIVFPIIIFMVVLAEPIIHILLSDKYLIALPLLQILPFFVLFAVLSSPYQSKFQGIDQPQFARNRVVIMVTINIILNIILIPKDIQSIGITLFGLGAVGAAIATVISYLFGLIYIRLISWKKSEIKGNKCIIYHGISALLCGILLSYLSTMITIGRWYELIAIALLGFGLYISILYLINEFRKQDFYLFIDTINLRKMIHYIKDEIRK